jgi:hypothetical protein
VKLEVVVTHSAPASVPSDVAPSLILQVNTGSLPVNLGLMWLGHRLDLKGGHEGPLLLGYLLG